jgi:hypothetical protein
MRNEFKVKMGSNENYQISYPWHDKQMVHGQNWFSACCKQLTVYRDNGDSRDNGDTRARW